MPKYTSNDQLNLKVGISAYSEDLTSLEVVGRLGIGTDFASQSLHVEGNSYISNSVGIGTTNPDAVVTSSNTSKLAVGIVTANQYYGSGLGLTGITSATNATHIYGGGTGQLLYQAQSGVTSAFENGSTGFGLFSRGIGQPPQWLPAAPSGAIEGLLVFDEGAAVGLGTTYSGIDFRGLQVVATGGNLGGIATVTISEQPYVVLAGLSTNVIGGIASVTSLDVNQPNGISTVGNFEVTSSGLGATVGSPSGVTTYYGDGIHLTGIVTSITAGANLQVDQSTGNVTITGIADTAIINADSLYVSGIATVQGDLEANSNLKIVGSIQDQYDNVGLAGSVLSSTGSGWHWIDPIGTQGYQGYQGDTGAQGYQGYQGNIGAQGAQGHQGDTGAQGAQGHQGDTGAQGEIGSQGNQGNQGHQGDTGAQGEIGSQGNQGNQGYQGSGGLATTDADTLDTLDSTQFLRSDTGDEKTSGTLRFNDNVILSLGTGDDAEFFCDGSHFYLDLNSGIGNFYIRDGTTTQFTFDDAGHFTATGNVNSSSDISLKKDIEIISDALEKVLKIRGVNFTRIDSPKEVRQTGVIAQEVEKVLPEAVSINQDGVKSVAYGNMIGLIIEAIKEQQKQIEELRSKI